MKSAIALLMSLAGLSVPAHAQLMRMYVSSDGLNFSDNVTVSPGATVQVLVTASYTGTAMAVAGFGSANFQPTVSNWHTSDTLLPLRQGGNTNPADQSGMVWPQFYTGITDGLGQHIGAGYVLNTYGRVLPMGRTYLDGATALTGFVHDNPDGSGQTYLRIAQASNTNWIGQTGNTSGGSGVNCAQLFQVGRTTNDPDFWGNYHLSGPGDPFPPPDPDPNLNYRRVNVELFRFAFTLDSSTDPRTLTVDAPIAGQQVNTAGVRYMGYYTSVGQPDPGFQPAVSVQQGFVNVVPAPAAPLTLMLLGLSGLSTRLCRRK